ncbi:TraB/GumN family protein [Pseudoxanthomonas sp. UTMC 1351]|uniref:TraB/GumN family protein n=1 Tax=Pseudoxanthomonas sp. UTMC 1351 TaxID=2695853 RepID=UPI0034CFAF27
MRLLCIATLLLCFTSVAAAQSSAAVQAAPAVQRGISTALPAITDMDVMVVSGVQPGPGMWRVSKGDHVLWIMGTLSPVPKKMTWLSRDVEATIAVSQQVLKSPGASIDSDLGIFRSALLIPSLFKARKNPDGATLKEVLPPDLYARWQVLKLKYIGRDAGIEKWRPIFAAHELYEAAIKKSGLATSGVVTPVVDKAAKRHDVKIVSPIVRLKVEDPKKAIKEFSGTALGDVECFRKTLDRLENDLPVMTLRANAWAIGDIEALRALPYDDQNRACIRAMLEAGVAQKRGLDTLPQKVEAEWMAAAETALRENASTFALLPISELLKPDGYLVKLQAKGYEVEAP